MKEKGMEIIDWIGEYVDDGWTVEQRNFVIIKVNGLYVTYCDSCS